MPRMGSSLIEGDRYVALEESVAAQRWRWIVDL